MKTKAKQLIEAVGSFTSYNKPHIDKAQSAKSVVRDKVRALKSLAKKAHKVGNKKQAKEMLKDAKKLSK